MKKRTIALGFLLAVVAAECRAQMLQFFQTDGTSIKYETAGVDSLSLNASEGTTTVFFADGSIRTYPIEQTDSVVWYDDSGSILSRLRSKGNYTNFLRLCDEDDSLRDRLGGAADFTVFAADDNGWQQFFNHNATLPSDDPWHNATSYGALTAAQKQLLLLTAINNPFRTDQFGAEGKMRTYITDPQTGYETWTPLLTSQYCEANGITEDDQRILFGSPLATPWTPAATLTATDEACNNGYINSVSVPLKPVGSMADVIRSCSKTTIFAALMEKAMTQASDYILYDPSKTSRTGNGEAPSGEDDMAAMIVPSDDALWDFFTNGGGRVFLEVYYAQKGTSQEVAGWTVPQKGDTDELLLQMGSIPASTLARTIMMNAQQFSFAGTVPSKWNLLRNPAMEPLFIQPQEAVARINTCIAAANGMVYVIDQCSMPADYNGVTTPVYVGNSANIMKWAVYNSTANSSYGSPSMDLNYFAYLKAPHQDITFFLPTDAALASYFDAVSLKSRTPRAINFSYAPGSFPVKLSFYNYYGPYNSGSNPAGTIGNPLSGSTQYSNDEVTNRLREILLGHTIVGGGTQDINSRNEYFTTFGGDVIKVVRNSAGQVVAAKGGFQLENERLGINEGAPGTLQADVEQGYESLANGQTFTIQTPLSNNWRSLWSLLTNDADYNGFGGDNETPYSQFYNLCMYDDDIIIGCGLVDGSLSNAQKNAALKKYYIFIYDNGLDENLSLLSGNTPYTAYIPTNEAVSQAIAQGLPTWDDIEADFNSHASGGRLTSFADSMRIQAKIKLLNNVIRAHFHYGHAFADQEPFSREYKTLAMDEKLIARKVTVSSSGNGTLSVRDQNGTTATVTDDKNHTVCDYTCNRAPVNTQMRSITVTTHRTGVVHQIDAVLGFSPSDVTWK